jgi:methylated-DNA-[protein]-cysteine S-methyltransferase
MTSRRKSKDVSSKNVLREPTRFELLCYDILCQVPKGKVTTYQLLAKAMKTRGARAVGNALNKNPFAPKVPCHRVVRSDGSLGGFANGAEEKKKLLVREGVRVHGDKIAELEKVLFSPKPVKA